jgi:PD-(D/E)XK nuclease superfamily protein
MSQTESEPKLAHALKLYFDSLAHALGDRDASFRLELRKYFDHVGVRLAETRKERELRDAKNAPAFNLFEYLGHQGLDEVGISRILANLLDPTGMHCQGDRFLTIFLRDILRTEWEVGAVTRIIREDLTRFSRRPRRRIDITVHLGDRGIGIENKPWAEEGEDQLKDYRYHLEKRYKGRFILVYLSGQGEEPEEPPEGRTASAPKNRTAEDPYVREGRY